MKKKALAILLVAVLSLAGLAGCSGGDTHSAAEAPSTASAQEPASEDSTTDDTAAPADGVQLTVWAWDKGFNGFALEEAEKLYDGASIHFEEMGKADALQKIHTVLASGVTDDLPEIVLISDLQVPGYLMSYPGAFRPMEDVIDFSDFADYKVAAVTYDGTVYGVPFDSGVAGLFYRTDYMEEIGVTAEDMQSLTWQDYLALGPRLKEAGHLLQTYNPNDIAEFQIMLQSAGSWYTKDDEADFVDNAALKECFDIFKTLNESDYVKVVSDWTEFAGALNGGDVACVLRGSWISATLMDAQDQSGLWAAVPVPTLSVSGATAYSNQGGSSWFVLNGSENAEIAADFFAETFGKSTDLYNTILEQKNIIGTYLPANGSPAYSAEDAFYGGQKINADLADWMSKIPAVNTGAFSTEAQSALLGVTPQILNGDDLNTCLADAAAQYAQSIQ